MSRLNDHKDLFTKKSKRKLVENFTNSELQKKVIDKAIGWVSLSHFGPRSFFTSKTQKQKRYTLMFHPDVSADETMQPSSC